MSGLLAGAQAALLSLLVVTVPALAAYVATSADPSNAGVGWAQSVAIGGALWLMGHGAILQASGADVSLIPLGLTGLALFSSYASARRSAHRAVSAWLAGIGGYTVVVSMVALLVGTAGPLGAGPLSTVRTVVGTVVVSGLGMGAGLVRLRRLRDKSRRLWSPVHPFVRSGVTAGAMVVCLLAGVAALVTCAWILSGRAATGDVVAGLGVDTFGGLLLAVAQLAVLPNLVLWVMAWLVGPGFSVGAGTLYSPDAVIAGPVPALPLLGALPAPGSEGGPLSLVPLVVVVAGGVAGWWLHRRVATTKPWHPLVVAATTGLSAGVLAALVCVLAGGSAGPGRLAVIGAPAALVGLVTAVLTMLGATLVAVPADPVVRAAASGRVRALTGRRGPRGQEAGSTPESRPGAHAGQSAGSRPDAEAHQAEDPPD